MLLLLTPPSAFHLWQFTQTDFFSAKKALYLELMAQVT